MPSSARGRTSSSIAHFHRAAAQIVGIMGVAEFVRPGEYLLRRNMTELERDLFEAHDLEALAVLDRSDERGSIVKTFMRAGVEPGKATAEPGNMERGTLQIGAIDVGDFKLASGRRSERRRDPDHVA